MKWMKWQSKDLTEAGLEMSKSDQFCGFLFICKAMKS